MKKKEQIITLLIFLFFLSYPFYASAIELTTEICNQAGQYGYTDTYYDGSSSVYAKAIDLCRIDLSIQNKDSSMCENIYYNKRSTQLACYLKYATYYKDSSICENVKGTNTGNADGMSLKNSCYAQYAKQLNDYQICDKLSGGINLCYSEISKSLNDSKICEKIKDKLDKEICYEQFGIFSGKCAKEGGNFSRVERGKYPTHCCNGLTEWDSGMDTRKVIDEKCVSTELLGGWPVGTCIKCGDGICGNKENICNCPQDCENPRTPEKIGLLKRIINWFQSLFE